MDENVSPETFWKSINIWVKNPHVVNRRLSGIIQISNHTITDCNLNCQQLLQIILSNVKFEESPEIFSKQIVDCLCLKPDSIVSNDGDFESIINNVDKHNENTPCIHVCVQKLVPRGPKYKETYRICLLGLSKSIAIFYSIAKVSELIDLSPEVPYCAKLNNNQIILECLAVPEDESKMKWLREKLLPRLIKWTSSVNSTGSSSGSLNLISLDKYNTKYQLLKEKYGQEMVKIWPENTDPSKFVFEDVAIASYLLILWEDERELLDIIDKQSFVDLGCGNGLLVYILNSEGHPGKGIDVRKRGIWDLYPNYVKLEVEPITPSEKCLYKDTDWLIGNHSDELTPWIPVIAARSSYNCRFFLLPCCAYEFDGRKYQRHDSSKSQYNEYLDYVKEICSNCGIKTEIDRLKIPSTKRICLVGTDRLYSKECHESKIIDIQTFIDSRCANGASLNDKKENDSNVSSEHWVHNFTPREGIEKVRNCTKIDKNIINEIITSVTTNLLNIRNVSISKWNAGGCMSLNDIAKLLSPDVLKILKKECGGLQTLLRNNHHIFEVISGSVKLRHPRSKSDVLKHLSKKQNKKMKPKNIVLNQKPCWFHSNHPDGCPLPSDLCSFVHSS